MSNILDGLNKEQCSAASCIDGPLLILAGAGSGKTRVLTTRIAHMVQSGIKPYQIMAVTFTNKAAKEMKARLEKILGEEVVKSLWVGTFHSICGRILRQDIENYKTPDGRSWQKNFVIFDQNESLTLIKNALKAENMDEKVYAPKMVQAAISAAKNKMQNAHDFATRARDYRTEKISKIFDIYEQNLATNNALDFDDLLLMSVNLIEKSPETLEKYHNRFKHILVDEYQDTNITQYKLINMLYTGNKEVEALKKRSLCVVGDVDQSIYSWRGADYKIILNFQKDFKDANVIKLEQNYRSTATILEAANKVIVNNTQRVSKNLYSNKGQGEKISVFEANDDVEEANYIARQVKKLSYKKNSFSQMAVLYRTNAQSRAIEEAFMARGIPYHMVGGLKFYDRKEIKDIVGYLKLIYNNNDSQSLQRIINVPKRAIGATTVKKINDIAQSYSTSMFSIIENIDNFDEFSAGVKLKLKGFIDLIKTLSQKQESMPLSEFIAQLADDTGYINALREEKTEESEGRLENIQEFISVAREFEEIDTENELGEFLSQVALVSDIDSLGEGPNSVTLMTLHAAKGLEFPVVFMSGLEEGIFPHTRSLNSNSEMEEERRLMYVGVTRAEDTLYLSYAKRRRVWGDYKYYTQSRFLSEIPAKLLDTNYSTSSDSNSKKGGTFKDAVKSIEDRQKDTSGGFGKGFVAPRRQNITKNTTAASSTSTTFGKGFVAPINKTKTTVSKGFGSDFVAPKPESKTTKNIQPSRNLNTLKKQENIKKTEDAKLEAKKAIEELKAKIQKEKEQKVQVVKEAPQLSLFDQMAGFTAVAENIESTQKVVSTEFAQGDRVFHEKYGIGTIKELAEIGSSAMYTVDFGKQGEKALDAEYSKLKKF